jgi:NAD(P)-dependent dehydrogenase (short-subunit alcohol dehydrogenase family)
LAAQVQNVGLPSAGYDSNFGNALLDINLKGNFLLAKHATPRLAARGGGVIIFNSSVAGLRGFPRLAH